MTASVTAGWVSGAVTAWCTAGGSPCVSFGLLETLRKKLLESREDMLIQLSELEANHGVMVLVACGVVDAVLIRVSLTGNVAVIAAHRGH
jgi:hypothetical protein